MTIQEIFASLPTRFKSDKAKDYHTVFQFEFTDHNQTDYFFSVSIQDAVCTVQEGKHPHPNCTVRTSSELYVAIELGKTNAQTALMNGEIQIDNLMEMMRFSTLFRKYETPQNPAELKGIPTRKPSEGPLKGIKVLDLTRLLPGPLATMLMADMGAEIIKVESPHFQDYSRDFDFKQGGESIFYLAYNRSKRNLALDYSTAEGKEIFLELVKEVDVLMEQFRPDVMEKLGLDYATVSQINPKIIYVSITGYGQTGPYRNLAGHDLNYITLAGLLAGNQFSAPQMPTIQMADIAGGSYMAVIGCLSALLSRNFTGKGQWVDVSMMDGVLPLNINPLALYWATNHTQAREANFLAGGLVNYGIYPCKDGKYIALGTLEVKFWEKFCTIVGKPEWKDRMLAKNAQELSVIKQELTEFFRTEEQAYWTNLGLQHDLLLNAVYEIDELENDPQIQARKMIVSLPHPTAGTVKGIGVPIKFSETQATPAWSAPLLGEDTWAILQEIGFDETKIKDLLAKGIIQCA